MKFEDLKLPQVDLAFDRYENRYRVARAVYDQMREHYEAKLAEAKPKPEELFEHPDMPGKKFRRLKVGEMIQEGDWTAVKGRALGEVGRKTLCAGLFVKSGDGNFYYREVPQPAPEWRLPDPPPGQQWHRTDWTADMLPEEYRPLLLGEPWVAGDEVLRSYPNGWEIAGDRVYDALNSETTAENWHCRTRRPLPAPVEYVPLEPGDVPPGSAVRYGKDVWYMVECVEPDGVVVRYNNTIPWQGLAHYEILRPGSKTWEPCKKPKP